MSRKCGLDVDYLFRYASSQHLMYTQLNETKQYSLLAILVNNSQGSYAIYNHWSPQNILQWVHFVWKIQISLQGHVDQAFHKCEYGHLFCSVLSVEDRLVADILLQMLPLSSEDIIADKLVLPSLHDLISFVSPAQFSSFLVSKRWSMSDA